MEEAPAGPPDFGRAIDGGGFAAWYAGGGDFLEAGCLGSVSIDIEPDFTAVAGRDGSLSRSRDSTRTIFSARGAPEGEGPIGTGKRGSQSRNVPSPWTTASSNFACGMGGRWVWSCRAQQCGVESMLP